MMEVIAGGGEGAPGGAPTWDEDCLTLNVLTPATDTARRPVMVWIHGGGFTGGTGAIPWYDGTSFATRGDLVVVTINSRLGALGFLHLGGHDPDEAGSGNAGLLDQVAALEWVRDNIEGFGGDPGNVTIFGESAGGMSVATLLGLPRARGLFHRAIAQSGAAHHVQGPDDAGEVTDRVLADLELPTVAALRDIEAARLLEAQVRVSEAVARERAKRGLGIGLPFTPVRDGVAIDQEPLTHIGTGLNADVGLLTGTTRDEWNVFALMLARGADLDTVRRRLARLVPDPDPLLDTYARHRSEATPDDLLNAIITDHVFRIPAIRLAEAHLAAQRRAGRPEAVHLYRFDYASTAFEGRLGACHALEIPFVFHNLDKAGVELFCGEAPPSAIADAMHDAWISFARTGEPGHAGIPAWPTYDEGGRPTMCFDERTQLVDDPDGTERAAWDGLR
jgi:para-nitrobenzyl esterase